MTDPTLVFPVQASDVPRYQNVLAVYSNASELERRRGRRTWPRAWDLARALAETHWHKSTQRRTIQAAAILAALSQHKSWSETVELATEAFKAGGQLNGGHFSAVTDKVALLFAGELPYDVLSGPSVRSRFTAIATRGETLAVPVDRHAAHVAYGRIMEDRERGQALRQTSSRNGYLASVDAYGTAAAAILHRDGVNLWPAQLQAICGVAWTNVLLGEDRGFMSEAALAARAKEDV